MKKIAFLFPGQGSQFVGMGKDIYENFLQAKTIFDEANEVLGIDLEKICFEGPLEELRKTNNTQPAILTHSVAMLRCLELEPDIAAGHSLGEYSAYVSSSSISFADALRIVRQRGELMYEAGVRKPGTMAAILGLKHEIVEEICKDASSFGIVVAANYNSPYQVTISGEILAVEKACELAKAAGAKSTVKLDVSGAFHSPLMESAYLGLKETLEKVNIDDAKFPVVANVNAQPIIKSNEIRNFLIMQLLSPVRWESSIMKMREMGVSLFIEVGPGKVLSGLIKKMDGDIEAKSLSNINDLKNFGNEWRKEL